MRQEDDRTFVCVDKRVGDGLIRNAEVCFRHFNMWPLKVDRTCGDEWDTMADDGSLDARELGGLVRDYGTGGCAWGVAGLPGGRQQRRCGDARDCRQWAALARNPTVN